MASITLSRHLNITRCPHCSVDMPTLTAKHNPCFSTQDYTGQETRFWNTYVCSRCGGCTTAWAFIERGAVVEFYPPTMSVHEAIPEKARNYLSQAILSKSAPSGAVMLSASSVDAMLKDKGYTSGSLYNRIDKAKDDNLITDEMAQWAHEIRLDANDERHADEGANMPTSEEAQKCIDFTVALAELLFVLPARIERGRQQTQ